MRNRYNKFFPAILHHLDFLSILTLCYSKDEHLMKHHNAEIGKVRTWYSDSSTLVLRLWYYQKNQQVLGTRTLRLTCNISWTRYFLSTFMISKLTS